MVPAPRHARGPPCPDRLDPVSLSALRRFRSGINNVASLIAEHRSDEASLERAYQLAMRLRDLDVAQFKDTLGWVHFRRGEYHAAADYLESAVEGLPEHALVRYHLAQTYAALERHDDARAQLTKAAELVGEGEPLGEKIKEALGREGKPPTLN